MLILVPYLSKIAVKLMLLDIPNEYRKIHKYNVPLIGGISIALSVIIVELVNMSNPLLDNTLVYSLMSGGVVLLVTGVIDDKISLSPKVKLIIQCCCAYFLVEHGVFFDQVFDIIGLANLPVFIKQLITIIFIVGTINAYNLIDGIDGLAGSLFLVAFIWITCVSLYFGNHGIALFGSAIIGGLVGFLKFNLSVIKNIFLGDSGSLFLGFVLSGLCIIISEQSFEYSYSSPIVIGTLSLISIPIIDEIRVFITRLNRRKSPFLADRTHIHHILLQVDKSHTVVRHMLILSTIFIFGSSLAISFYVSIVMSLIWLLLIFIAMISLLSFQDQMSLQRKALHCLEYNLKNS